jgi:cobalt transporter subunit CbtB
MVTNDLEVLGTERTERDARIRIGASWTAIIAMLTAIALGITILFVVGFSHSDLLHAAAHDVRHAAGFPCH